MFDFSLIEKHRNFSISIVAISIVGENLKILEQKLKEVWLTGY